MAAPVVLLLATWLVLIHTPPWIFSGGTFLFSLCAAVIIARALAPHSYTGRVLQWRPFVALGLISYSLYLWHLPVLAWSGQEGRGGLGAVLAGLVSVVYAAASYRLIEQPFRRRRSRSRTPDPAALSPATL